MTVEAQNALLKTLEEPPEYAIIILITSNKEALLDTIKSRCGVIKFLPISILDLNKYLINQGIDENRAQLLQFLNDMEDLLIMKRNFILTYNLYNNENNKGYK